jgi:hypothetical protein
LIVTHRLGGTDGLCLEHVNTREISFYSSRELAALRENADEMLRPVIAIGGLRLKIFVFAKLSFRLVPSRQLQGYDIQNRAM